MIVDANDFNVEILGKSNNLCYNDEELKQIIKDNPAGQSNQLTPIVLIRKNVGNIGMSSYLCYARNILQVKEHNRL